MARAAKLYNTLGVFLPLIAVNCAILGGSLFLVERNYDFGESLVFGLGAGVGWALAMFTPEKLRRHVVLSVGHPANFRSAPRIRSVSGAV